MLVIFSHGKESGPQGTKINYLSKVAQDLGWKTHSIDYRNCQDVNERVALLQSTIHQSSENNIVLVGSSMGGYVATAVANNLATKGLFLMCPAFYLPNYPIQTFTPSTDNITIVHGWNDTIVPFQSSVKFGQKHHVNLHLIDDNHRLIAAADFLQATFRNFLLNTKL